MTTPKPFTLAKSRRAIQWMVVVGTLVIGLRHIMPGEASRGGSFDSFCAFGGIETILPYLFTGHTLKSTNLLNFSVLLATLGVALVAGRAFCGWLCGLGAIQDFVAEWTRKLFGEKRHIRGRQSKTILPLRLPPAVDRPLRYAKYFVLAAILITSLYMVFPPLREFCPVRAVFGLKMTTLLWITLVVFLAGSMLVERFWCKYLCPLGAALAVFNKISPARLVMDHHHCNNCGRCDIECSMGIADVPHQLDHPECVRCMECLDTCAREGSLTLQIGYKENQI
ncbi:MAG: 4Fe-4S binding protein [Anaerolineaceae bacterium]|jgi:polyferredoxin|nr:MAG: 4Fe-4S binding protein [Anaerolineaceae bacterium]